MCFFGNFQFFRSSKCWYKRGVNHPLNRHSEAVMRFLHFLRFFVKQILEFFLIILLVIDSELSSSKFAYPSTKSHSSAINNISVIKYNLYFKRNQVSHKRKIYIPFFPVITTPKLQNVQQNRRIERIVFPT